jgi:transcriptional regulator with XRE-family HTH domain
MKEYFSKRLEKAMKSKNLSSYRIAKEMGISPSTIANYLNGVTTPSSSKLNDLSLFLEVNRDWLEFGEGEMENETTQDIGNSNIVSEQENKILDAFLKVSEKEDITITELERRIGASKGVLSRALKNNTDIQAKWVQSLVGKYPQYNIEWILTGKGQMLKNDPENQEILKPEINNSSTEITSKGDTNISKRIKEIIDRDGVSINAFSKKIGVSNSYFNKLFKTSRNVGSDIIEKIARTHSEINPNWLITGEGPMLKSDAESQEIQNPESGENISPIKERILQYLGYKGIKKVDFYEKIRLNPSNFKGAGLKSDLSGNKIANILSLYPEINPGWLIMGEGEMLKRDTNDQVNETDNEPPQLSKGSHAINGRIDHLIKFYNLNVSQVAKKLEVAPTVINNIIKGRKSKPSYDLLVKILESFDRVSSEWLITGEGEMLKQLPISEQAVNRATCERVAPIKQVTECVSCKEKDRIVKEMEDRINELQRDKERLWRIVEAGEAKNRIKDNKAG